jgi:hypothetical protein
VARLDAELLRYASPAYSGTRRERVPFRCELPDRWACEDHLARARLVSLALLGLCGVLTAGERKDANEPPRTAIDATGVADLTVESIMHRSPPERKARASPMPPFRRP